MHIESFHEADNETHSKRVLRLRHTKCMFAVCLSPLPPPSPLSYHVFDMLFTIPPTTLNDMIHLMDVAHLIAKCIESSRLFYEFIPIFLYVC